MKEYFRKRLVGLKRSPQIIPILLTLVCCFIYTFSLSSYSSASQGLYQDKYISDIQAAVAGFKVPALYRNPALYMFVQTLFSILLPITFLSVFKKGKRNNFMFSVALVMIVLMIALDVVYFLSIRFYTFGLPEGFNLDTSDPANQHIMDVRNGVMTNSMVHLVFLAITLVVTLVLPLIKAGLNKINTSVEDEYDKLMEQKTEEELMIELEDE